MVHSVRSFMAFVLVAVLVAACGGGTSSGSPTSAPAASVAPAATVAPSAAASVAPVQGIDAAKTITVGASIAQSGPYATAAAVGWGALTYFDSVNAKGGVNGYKFNYKVVDDQNDPTKTVTAIRQLWEQDKVFALLMPYGSGPTTAVKQDVTTNNIPLIFPYASSTIYFGENAPVPANVFGFQASYLSEVQSMVDFAAKQKGIKKVAIIHTTDEFGMTGVDGLTRASKALGVSVVGDVGYDATETNYAPLGQRIAASGAEAIVVWAIPGAANAIAAAEQAGYKGMWLLVDVFRGGSFLASLVKTPNLANRTYLIYHQKTVAQMTVSGSEFATAYKAKYPQGDPDPALTGWTAAAMFVDAVKTTTANNTPLNWERLKATLESWQGKNIEAAIGMSFSKTSHIGAEKAQIFILQSDNTWKVAQDFTALPK